MIHRLCRQGFYPFSEVKRFPVPEDKVAWCVEFPEYEPAIYTAPHVIGKPWADPEIGQASFNPAWNSLDGQVNRKSFLRDYALSKDGYPLNPVGRTGIKGRGRLGRWGPNHAADPIVTRWKRDGLGGLEVNASTGKPVLEFVAIRRQDTSEWAIPGGMVDPGETVSSTLKREFLEEALDSLQKTPAEKRRVEEGLKDFFDRGNEVYKGYVDDHRNTDNAWIETIACHFHDDDDSVLGKLNLKAGDDASDVCWININGKLKLYATHIEFVKKVVENLNAHW